MPRKKLNPLDTPTRKPNFRPNRKAKRAEKKSNQQRISRATDCEWFPRDYLRWMAEAPNSLSEAAKFSAQYWLNQLGA
jgi:hypothetical protein